MTDRSREQAGSRMEPDSNLPAAAAHRRAVVADLLISFPSPRPTRAAVAREPTCGNASKASCGCCAAALAGRTCRGRSPRTSPVGDVSSSGPATACGTKRGVGWSSQLDQQGAGRLGRRLRRRHVRLGEKGGDLVGPTKRGKGTKLMVLVDGAGLPLAVDVESASPAGSSL